MSVRDARNLVERELGDVRVVRCVRCAGKGELPELAHLICPDCQGCGKTTAQASQVAELGLKLEEDSTRV